MTTGTQLNRCTILLKLDIYLPWDATRSLEAEDSITPVLRPEFAAVSRRTRARHKRPRDLGTCKVGSFSSIQAGKLSAINSVSPPPHRHIIASRRHSAPQRDFSPPQQRNGSHQHPDPSHWVVSARFPPEATGIRLNRPLDFLENTRQPTAATHEARRRGQLPPQARRPGWPTKGSSLQAHRQGQHLPVRDHDGPPSQESARTRLPSPGPTWWE